MAYNLSRISTFGRCYPGGAWPPLFLLLFIFTWNFFGHTFRSLITEPLDIYIFSSDTHLWGRSDSGLAFVDSTLRRGSNLRLQLNDSGPQGLYFLHITGNWFTVSKSFVCTPTSAARRIYTGLKISPVREMSLSERKLTEGFWIVHSLLHYQFTQTIRQTRLELVS